MNTELKTQKPTTGALTVLRRMFKGNSKQTLNRIIQRCEGLTDGVPADEAQLKQIVSKFTSQILGSEAYENQLTYLKTVKKPRKLEVFEWLTRIQNIIYILPFLDLDRSILTDEEVIRDIVLPNIPVEARMELKILGGQKIPWDALVDKLEYIFVRLNYNQTKSRGGNNQFRKGNNNKRNFRKGKSNGKSKKHENFKSEKKNDSDSDDDKADDSDLDSDSEEETHMIRKKKTSKKKDNEAKPSSCSILVNVPHDDGRKTFVGLIDTGTSASLANAKAVRYCKRNEKKKETDWSTQGGAFATKKKATITGVKFPQFTKNRSLEFAMHLFEKKKDDKYDFILGRDLLQTVGIDILNSTGTLRWDDIEIKMMPSRMARDLSTNELEEIFTTKKERNTKILDAEYTKPDLREIAAAQEHLTGLQREAFLKMLQEKEAAFMGVRGTWNGDPVEFKLKKDKKKPFYTKPYLIPKSLYATTRKEVDRLEKEVGLLTKRTDLKYLSACFVIPKKRWNCEIHYGFSKIEYDDCTYAISSTEHTGDVGYYWEVHLRKHR